MIHKIFPYIFFIALVIAGSCMLSSCSDNGNPIDPTLGQNPEEPIPIPVGPSLSFGNEVNFLSGPTATVRPGSQFSLILKGMKGDSILTDLEVLLNGQPLPTSDFTVNGETPTSNFFVLADEDRDEFEWIFEIKALADSTRVIYEFQLKAKDGRTDGVALTIDTDLTETSPPNIELLTTEEVVVVLDDDVEAEFLIRVDALGSEMDSITMYSGSNVLEADRVSFDGNIFTSNPLPLEGDDRKFFEKKIGIKPVLAIEQRYTMELKDALGSTYSLELIFKAI